MAAPSPPQELQGNSLRFWVSVSEQLCSPGPTGEGYRPDVDMMDESLSGLGTAHLPVLRVTVTARPSPTPQKDTEHMVEKPCGSHILDQQHAGM